MHPIIQEYCNLVKFLGGVLPSYVEVALHDYSNPDHSIVAIANGHVTGRTLGYPLGGNGLQMLRERAFERQEMYIRFRGYSEKHPNIISSTKFIMDEDGNPLGVLCINYDYRQVQSTLQTLTELFLLTDIPEAGISEAYTVKTEKYPDRMEDVVSDILWDEIAKRQVSVERMTQEEKIYIVERLEARGVFFFKGAVAEVAKGLQSSEATIYRYLSKINKNKS